MNCRKILPAEPELLNIILTVRSQRVILDTDLARIYGVQTKRLNEQFRRNRKRFPADFAFQLTARERADLRSQFATSSLATASATHGGRRYLPIAFTEHGALMAATILNSPRAIAMSIYVMRAFVKMRELLHGGRDLARKLAALEKELRTRLDVHEVAIVEILQRVMSILDPPPPPPEPPKPQIGFHAVNQK